MFATAARGVLGHSRHHAASPISIHEYNLVTEAVEIGRLGDIALDGRRTRTEKGGGCFELCLPAARDVNARASRKP